MLRNGTRVRLVRPSPKLRLSQRTGTVRDIVDREYECYRVQLDGVTEWVWPDGHSAPLGGNEIYELAENLEILPAT